MRAKIAVVGAGIYGGATAIRLAQRGHAVTLHDPLGLMRAASSINQYRVHRGYHYPRSENTISEVLEAYDEFCAEFRGAIVDGTDHYYAMPKEGSHVSAEYYTTVMGRHGLELEETHPDWMDFTFIDRCWRVKEAVYDCDKLRAIIGARLVEAGIRVERVVFDETMEKEFDFTIYATYGLSGSRHHLFPKARYQIAEKILVDLPPALRRVALVVVDGPFTGFDPYGDSDHSLFGSALHTNHWETTDPDFAIPAPYAAVLNGEEFRPVSFMHFERMRVDCAKSVPWAAEARYIGSRFTVRVVEQDRANDQRILHVARSAPNVIHLFSGKVVSAVKAARLVADMIAGHG